MQLLRVSLIPIAAILFMLTGCTKDDAIQQYTVAHEAREPIRLCVAILPHNDLVWFIRLSGPESQVNEHFPAFKEFVKSIRFDDKNEVPITLVDPKDWKKDPPSDERFAGYRIDAKPKQLEVTVTRLPLEKYSLLSNVHRWQKQIHLPLAEGAKDLHPYVREEQIAGQPVTWVDMTGLGVHSVSKAPEKGAGLQRKPLAKLPFKQKKAQMPFQYTLPAGWTEKNPGQFAERAYEVSNREQRAEVTLTALQGDGGGLASNINRWRKQVQLPGISNREIEQSTDTLRVAGIKSHYVDIANPKGPAAKNRTLGVIVPLDNETWFIKMSGPLDWVGQNKNAFETFVKSFQMDAR